MRRSPWIAAAVFIGYLFVSAVPVECASTLTKIPPEKIKEQIPARKQSRLKAGVAKVDITPAVGTPLAGYSKRRGKPSTGIRDPLYVRALALTDGEDSAVFVSADILIFPRPLAEEILKQITLELKIPRDAVVLSATHTHSGMGAIAPGFLHEFVFGQYDPKITEGLKARVIWAVRQALEHQEPVQWGIASGAFVGMTENRRNPLGFVDPRMGVFLLEMAKGQPLAVMVNAAAHPTILRSNDFRFSADFPGELTRQVEAAYPGSVCLFMNGAAGDVRPSGNLGNDPEEKLKRFSGALAEMAIGIVNQIAVQPKGDLVAWGWRMRLPTPQMRFGPFPIPALIGRLMRPTVTYLNLVALNDIVFVPLQVEITTELGQLLRHKLALQGAQPFLLGYANGYLGYAVTPAEYKDGSYESWMTWYGPFFGEFIVEGIELLAKPYFE